MDGSGRREALSAWSGRSVHAVAGIGNPERFFAMLEQAGLKVRGHAFDDHHHYQGADLRFPEALPVLMTEKDAVKCRTLAACRLLVPARRSRVCRGRSRRAAQENLMEARLLDILACPLCKGPLNYERTQSVLVCHADRLAFPIARWCTVMLEEEARQPEPGRSAAGALMSDFRVVIPARFASTRLPGKPLLRIADKPLIQWVYESARRSRAVDVCIATDDDRIAESAQTFGAPVVTTSISTSPEPIGLQRWRA